MVDKISRMLITFQQFVNDEFQAVSGTAGREMTMAPVLKSDNMYLQKDSPTNILKGEFTNFFFGLSYYSR